MASIRGRIFEGWRLFFLHERFRFEIGAQLAFKFIHHK